MMLPAMVGTAAAVALTSAALFVQIRSRRAERSNPPRGRFITVDGVRLHYVSQGDGPPVVLLHGNGALVQDFELSGLAGQLAQHYRVFVFDRPGYGYSNRPRSRVWTPEAQAKLFAEAFRQLGLERPIVVGHSWGTLVAVALGLDHPDHVSRLVLLSGYFYPTIRGDVALMAPPSVPVVGDLLRFTISPLIARLIWRSMIAKLFSPNPIPTKFERFPIWMALRPGQLRASAAEAAMMIPAAHRLARRYQDLSVPTLIMAGEQDHQVTTKHQSSRLHNELPGSALRIIPRGSHMIHHEHPKMIVAALQS
jgi:pimeloyl-ACP methyl ester carboxylesterase